jgi:hypothetical protein
MRRAPPADCQFTATSASGKSDLKCAYDLTTGEPKAGQTNAVDCPAAAGMTDSSQCLASTLSE